MHDTPHQRRIDEFIKIITRFNAKFVTQEYHIFCRDIGNPAAFLQQMAETSGAFVPVLIAPADRLNITHARSNLTVKAGTCQIGFCPNTPVSMLRPFFCISELLKRGIKNNT